MPLKFVFAIYFRTIFFLTINALHYVIINCYHLSSQTTTTTPGLCLLPLSKYNFAMRTNWPTTTTNVLFTMYISCGCHNTLCYLWLLTTTHCYYSWINVYVFCNVRVLIFLSTFTLWTRWILQKQTNTSNRNTDWYDHEYQFNLGIITRSL